MFLLSLFEDLEDGEIEDAKSSSDGCDCRKFFFQLRLAVRTFSSWSSVSGAKELIIVSRLSTPYVLALGDSFCFGWI